MNITIIANKMDITYGFYMKHKMEAIERKLNKLINKDKKLMNKLPQIRLHRLNGKVESFRARLKNSHVFLYTKGRKLKMH